jgi:uncharacterized protein YecA (UPF0149 family)
MTSQEQRIAELEGVLASILDLNQTNVADLVWILDSAAELFERGGDTTWAQRARRYKTFFEKLPQRLKAENAALLSEEDAMNYEFGKLKALLTRAADTLAKWHSSESMEPPGEAELIAELRKAAE